MGIPKIIIFINNQQCYTKRIYPPAKSKKKRESIIIKKTLIAPSVL